MLVKLPAPQARIALGRGQPAALPSSRAAGPSLAVPAVLLGLAAAALGLLGLGLPQGRLDGVALLPTLIGVGAGCAALAWVRPQRAGLSPPNVMLTLGFCGMLLGLAFDVARSGPIFLDALCAQAAASDLPQAFALHLAYLPGMHMGMLAGGLLAIPSLRLLRPHCGRYLCALFAQNVLCSVWMLLGMTLGGLWLARGFTVGVRDALPYMMGGMFVGMTWGMVVSVALYRSYFVLRDRLAGR